MRQGDPIDFDNLLPLCPFCHKPFTGAPCSHCGTCFGVGGPTRHQGQSDWHSNNPRATLDRRRTENPLYDHCVRLMEDNG